MYQLKKKFRRLAVSEQLNVWAAEDSARAGEKVKILNAEICKNTNISDLMHKIFFF